MRLSLHISKNPPLDFRFKVGYAIESMSSNESIITYIEENRQERLTPKAIDLFSALTYLWENKEDEYIKISNKEASVVLDCHPTYIARLINELEKANLIRVESTPTKNGMDRRFYIDQKGDPHDV